MLVKKVDNLWITKWVDGIKVLILNQITGLKFNPQSKHYFSTAKLKLSTGLKQQIPKRLNLELFALHLNVQ